LNIKREERVLLIINCLAEHGNKRFKRLYEFIETAGVDLAMRYLKGHYRQVIVMKEKEATLAAFLSCLQELSADRRNLAVDVFFQLHGLQRKVRFYDCWVSSFTLGREIRRVVARDCLRLLYNTSCYGDSHSDVFLKAGFRVSIGAMGINTNGATEYPLFCRLWPVSAYRKRRPLTVIEIMRRADRVLPRRIQDRIAGLYFSDVDSKKMIRGDRNIHINRI